MDQEAERVRCASGGEEGMTIAEHGPADRGMLVLDEWDRHNGGIAQCASCGWEGVPVYRRGKPSTYCPVCERESDEDMFKLGEPEKPRPPKQGRNELCLCGSGLKYKRCHGS